MHAPDMGRNSAIPPRWALLLWMLAWLAGCPRPVDPSDRDRVTPLLEAADKLWDERGRWGFEGAGGKLAQAAAIAPRDPRIAWRLARLETGRGIAAEDRVAAARAYSEAREHAVRCLLDDPAVERAWTGLGWEEAIERVSPPRSPCLDWGTFAWARWFTVMQGGAATVDLPALDLLAARLATSPDPFDLGPWTEGLVAAHRPVVEGRDLDTARAALEAAIRQRPAELTPHADLVQWVAVPLADEALIALHVSVIEELPAQTPEDRRAKQRVAGAGTAETVQP